MAGRLLFRRWTPNYNYTQAIILLTDGLNTQDRWYGDGSSLGTSDDAKIDAREQLTCNNINAAGITLYTIQVNTDGDPTSTLLQKCAGSPGHYPDSNKFFLLTSANQILSVFTQIGTESEPIAHRPITAHRQKQKPGQIEPGFSLTLTQRYATELNN